MDVRGATAGIQVFLFLVFTNNQTLTTKYYLASVPSILDQSMKTKLTALQTLIVLAAIILLCVIPCMAGVDVKSILIKYPRLSSEPFGKGIYANVRNSGGKYMAKPETIRDWAEEPHISGTQLSYSWVELEPKKSKYRWDLIEADLEVWASQGKKCWIEVSTANKRARKGGSKGIPTPAWVFDLGVPLIEADNTSTYPLFWDPVYLKVWGDFIRAFGMKFDSDPRLEFISTGGYSGGHEPGLTSEIKDSGDLKEKFERAGFDGFIPDGIYLNKAIKPILKMFRHAFPNTLLAQTIHVKNDFDRALNKYAAGLGMIVISNGLGFMNLNAESRGIWRKRLEGLKTKGGFAEWGPKGRIKSMDLFMEKKKRKQAKRKGEKVEKMKKDKRKNDPNAMASLMEVYQAVLGDDTDSLLKPHSKISYLPLGKRIPSAETEEEWIAALKWAQNHLYNNSKYKE